MSREFVKFYEAAIPLVSLLLILRGIYTSQRRWLSVWYALLGCLVFITVSFVTLGIYSNFVGMSVLTTNNAIDGITAVMFIPGIIGANTPPRRR